MSGDLNPQDDANLLGSSSSSSQASSSSWLKSRFFFLLVLLAFVSTFLSLEEGSSIALLPATTEEKVSNSTVLLGNATGGRNNLTSALHTLHNTVNGVTGNSIVSAVSTSTEDSQNNPSSPNEANASTAAKTQTPAPPPPPYYTMSNRTISLIVELRGELGNQLSGLAGARITQLIASQKGINIQIVAQHQDKRRWTRGRDDIVKCFPNLRNLDFEGGIWEEEFRERLSDQNKWLTSSTQEKYLVDARATGIEYLKTLLLEQEKQQQQQQQQRGGAGESVSTNNNTPPIETTGAKYSVPFLKARMFAWIQILKDDYLYNDLREWLKFDEANCCAPGDDLPHEDEIVFHHRNFLAELKQAVWKKRHFIELSPNNTAAMLFGSDTMTSPTKKKIVIVSRFPDKLTRYVNALERYGHQVRVIFDHTGVQDFCFLTKAKSEIVGSYISTFLRWGSVLGNATKSRYYKVDCDPDHQNQSKTTTWSLQVGVRSFVFETYAQMGKY